MFKDRKPVDASASEAWNRVHPPGTRVRYRGRGEETRSLSRPLADGRPVVRITGHPKPVLVDMLEVP